MTQDRRITDKLPGQPLQWDEADTAGAASNKAAADLTSKITNTESARRFVLDWHLKHFPTDRTFAAYIMAAGSDSSEKLAGDFAWQLAKALEAMEHTRAAPAALPDARLVGLLREARATLEMWKDVAPAVSLCADIDKALSAAPTASQPARNDVIEQCAQQVERMASNISPVELCGEAVHEAASNVITNAAAAIRVLKDLATTTSQPDEARDAALEEAAKACDVIYDGWCGVSEDGPSAAQECSGAIRALKSAPTAASPSHPDPEKQQGWISVDEHLPDGRNCLAVYETSRGKQRIIRAMYVARFTIEAYGDDCYSEINDENDTEYLREGWYELIDNWGEYSSVHVSEGVVTNWMPLPLTPDQCELAGSARQGGEQAPAATEISSHPVQQQEQGDELQAARDVLAAGFDLDTGKLAQHSTKEVPSLLDSGAGLLDKEVPSRDDVRRQVLLSAARECEERATNWLSYEGEKDMQERGNAASILAQHFRYKASEIASSEAREEKGGA